MKKQVTLLFAILLSAISGFAQSDKDIPERPNPPRLVNNLSATQLLSADEENRLEQKLEKFANETSNQIVIVIVDDYAGLENYDYATRLGQKWGVGHEKEDNGVVILLKPTGGEGHRDLFIAPGYGLQGVIPDLATKQIRENEMNPYLKQGQYYTALDKGTDVIMALAKGEYNSDQYAKKNNGGSGKVISALMLFVFIFIILVFIRRGGGRGGRGGGGGMATGFFLGSMMGGGGRGFGGGGGGSSGGFGGFGGGSFGGGGSGGSW